MKINIRNKIVFNKRERLGIEREDTKINFCWSIETISKNKVKFDSIFAKVKRILAASHMEETCQFCFPTC